jgi:hypothetical protein
LTAFEELKANNFSSVGKQYYLAEPDHRSANCSASFPSTGGIGDVNMQNTQTILFQLGVEFYLMDILPKQRVRLSRLGEKQPDGELPRDHRAKVPIHVRGVTFAKEKVHMDIEVIN